MLTLFCFDKEYCNEASRSNMALKINIYLKIVDMAGDGTNRGSTKKERLK